MTDHYVTAMMPMGDCYAFACRCGAIVLGVAEDDPENAYADHLKKVRQG